MWRIRRDGSAALRPRDNQQLRTPPAADPNTLKVLYLRCTRSPMPMGRVFTTAGGGRPAWSAQSCNCTGSYHCSRAGGFQVHPQFLRQQLSPLAARAALDQQAQNTDTGHTETNQPLLNTRMLPLQTFLSVITFLFYKEKHADRYGVAAPVAVEPFLVMRRRGVACFFFGTKEG